MNRRFTVLLLALALIWTVNTPVMAKVHLIHYNYPGHGTTWNDYLVDRAKAFNALNPDIEVEILQAGTTGEYATKFSVMLAAGTPPDVTDFHPAMGATHIINGTFTDLRPYLAKDNINLLKMTGPSVMSVLTANNGAVWGVPADIYPVVTMYNEEILDNAGLPYPKNMGASWNWDQAVLTGRKTTIDANADGKPEQWGLDRMWARWYMWVHQAGGSLYDRVINPTKSNWNNLKVAKGLQFPLTIMQDGLGPKSNTPGYAQTYFWLGHTAISFVDGPGTIGSYLKDSKLRYNIAQQVRGPENAGSEITVDAFELVDASPNKEQAWKWLKFISLDVENHAKFVQMTGRAPSLAQLQSRYKQLCPYLPSNYMSFFETAAAPGTQTNYLLLKTTEINAIVNPMITKIFTGAVPVETAIEQIHEQVSAVLSSK